MIQRIQTLYLLLTFALMLTLYFFPLATFTGDGQAYEVILTGIRSNNPDTCVASTLLLFIVWGVATALPLVNIFLYKRRRLQMRLCLAEIVLALGVQVLAGVSIFNAKRMAEQLASPAVHYSAVGLIPLVCILLSMLAYRSVARDERLVRSLNRIR